MAKRIRSYVLTETAADDFRAARRWSLARWGKERTKTYFEQLHAAAEYVAAHQQAIAKRDDLIGNPELAVHAVGEHYLVYAPLGGEQIAVVALIRQTRDVPAIVEANSFQIRRQVSAALQQRADRY